MRQIAASLRNTHGPFKCTVVIPFIASWTSRVVRIPTLGVSSNSMKVPLSIDQQNRIARFLVLLALPGSSNIMSGVLTFIGV